MNWFVTPRNQCCNAECCIFIVMLSSAMLSVMTPLMAMLRSKCSAWLTQFTMLSTFELYQSKSNFIEGNQIMMIKMKVGI